MNTPRKKRKLLLAPALIVAAGLLLPVSASAQTEGGGLFDKGAKPEAEPQRGMLGNRSQGSGYGIFTEQFGSEENGGYQIGTEQFGHDAPLGSGLFIMAAAGAAYALKKRKKNN